MKYYCKKCGCTENRACFGGCSWTSPKKNLCSQCKNPEKQIFSLAEAIVKGLLLKTDGKPYRWGSRRIVIYRLEKFGIQKMFNKNKNNWEFQLTVPQIKALNKY